MTTNIMYDYVQNFRHKIKIRKNAYKLKPIENMQKLYVLVEKTVNGMVKWKEIHIIQ